MQYAILPLAFCAVVHAAPLQPASDYLSAHSARNGITLELSDHMARQSQPPDLSARQLADYPIENDIWDYDVTPASETLASLVVPSATADTTKSSASAFTGEEDPELFQILLHVENILSSSASPDEQIEWILDAIVHHTESLRESEEDLWSSDSILGRVDEILDDDSSDDEKVEIIFNEIMLHTKLRSSMERPMTEPVLLRIKAVLYGSESDQQKIKGILGEIAAHLGTSDFGTEWDLDQVSMGAMEDEAFPGNWNGEDTDDWGKTVDWYAGVGSESAAWSGDTDVMRR